MALAVIAAENQTFREDCGFDVLSMKKALQDHARGKRLRGVSTLSQQTAKNHFLWPGLSDVRKAFGAFLTVLTETLWSKRRIVVVFVNTVQMRPHIFSVGAASRIYFGSTSDRLSKKGRDLRGPSPEAPAPLSPEDLTSCGEKIRLDSRAEKTPRRPFRRRFSLEQPGRRTFQTHRHWPYKCPSKRIRS